MASMALRTLWLLVPLERDIDAAMGLGAAKVAAPAPRPAPAIRERSPQVRHAPPLSGAEATGQGGRSSQKFGRWRLDRRRQLISRGRENPQGV